MASLAITANGSVFAGLMGDGVFFNDATATSVAEEADGPPSEFQLEQNYPNPFNPSTTIRFSLAQRAHVSLRLFDAAGREVAVLMNEEREPGSHEVLFEAGSLPSGLYIYRLQAGAQTAARKLVLVR